MSYVTINDRFNLKSCNISEMSQQVKDDYIEQFKNDCLVNMSLYYLTDTDSIVLNKDHSNYGFYVFLVENYLEFDEEKRKVIREQSPESIKGVIQIIDEVIKNRMKARV